MTDTIPEALMADLRDLFLEAQPVDPALPEASVREQFETNELPSPRLVFIPAEPRRIPGQVSTARVPFTLELISSMDRQTPAAHRIDGGKIDTWLRGLRLTKRREVLSSRTYLHDLYNLHPVFSIREEDREQVARIRGEAIVTLAITE